MRQTTDDGLDIMPEWMIRDARGWHSVLAPTAKEAAALVKPQGFYSVSRVVVRK